ncbi:hypothetical protein [Sodalis praecaptivus]|uniref:hypothetical protein n=1 Tax=Sodalis praecaptivus TaxID=1239307 RepID=UPI0031F8AF87
MISIYVLLMLPIKHIIVSLRIMVNLVEAEGFEPTSCDRVDYDKYQVIGIITGV